MIIPIRCFSCGKPLGHLWEKYNDMCGTGKDSGEVLTELGLERYCCRSILMGQIDLIDTAAEFKKA
tara:strand:+ start:205 stop:402 length:198 start_codon:yes stop_codon:yes gene_type:complete